MIVVQLTLCTDAIGTTADFLFCNGEGFTTGTADTPANTFCEDALLYAGDFTTEMFAGDRVTGAVRAGFGTVIIDNADGRRDGWRSYAAGGRKIIFWRGDEGSAFPSGFTKVREAVMNHFTMNEEQVEVILRDRMEDFNKPVCTQKYSGAGGVNGMTSMAGQYVPAGYGAVFNASPVLVDPTLYMYQMSASYETSTLDQNVRDNGEVLSNGAAYSSQADMIANAPSAGQVRHWAPGGMFRLGSGSVNEITADRKFHDAATTVTSKLLEKLALDAGISAGDINTISSLGVNSGYYCRGDDTTFAQVMVRLAEGAGLYFGWDRLNKFFVGRLEDPVGGTSVGTLTDQIITSISRKTPDGMEAPVKAVKLRWAKNWKPLTTPAGSLSITDITTLRGEWFTYTVEDTAIATKHPYARVLERDSYEMSLFTFTAPSGEASRVLTLFKADREWYEVSLKLDTDSLTYDIGTILTLQYNRFGLSAGKKFVVTKVVINLDTEEMTLGLWG